VCVCLSVSKLSEDCLKINVFKTYYPACCHENVGFWFRPSTLRSRYGKCHDIAKELAWPSKILGPNVGPSYVHYLL